MPRPVKQKVVEYTNSAAYDYHRKDLRPVQVMRPVKVMRPVQVSRRRKIHSW